MDEPVVTSFKDILNKSWNIFRVSPLYKFQATADSFEAYTKSLAVHVASEASKTISKRPLVNIFQFEEDETTDSTHVGIHVMIPQEEGEKRVEFLLLLYHSAHVIPDFASGLLKKAVFSWLERQYDCKVIPLSLPSHTLRDLAMKWLDTMESNYLKKTNDNDNNTNKKQKNKRQKSNNDKNNNNNTSDSSAEDSPSHSPPPSPPPTPPEDSEAPAKPLELFQAPISPSLSNLTMTLPHTSLLNLLEIRSEENEDNEVKQTFMDAIYAHFKHNMRIDLNTLALTRVGTSIALVGEGKLKMFQTPAKVLEDIVSLY